MIWLTTHPTSCQAPEHAAGVRDENDAGGQNAKCRVRWGSCDLLDAAPAAGKLCQPRQQLSSPWSTSWWLGLGLASMQLLRLSHVCQDWRVI